MATVMAPVELPTGRRSYLNTGPTADIHDPNWIPVLNGTTYTPPSPSVEKEVSPYQQASFSPSASFSLFPNQAPSPKPRQSPSNNDTKSPSAPASILSDSRPQSAQEIVEPMPAISGALIDQPRREHQRRPTSASEEEKISVGAEAPAELVSAPGTDEGSSVVGEQSSNAPEHSVDDGGVSQSSRSSMMSTRKTGVAPPTSKYNRKPVTSMGTSIGRPSFVPSLPQTPHESPRLAPANTMASMPTAMPQSSSASILQPLPSPKQMPLDLPAPPEPVTTPKLVAAKSNASDRRQRALHSHPSNISLRHHSSSDEAEGASKPPMVPHKPRKSTDSRTTPRSTMYDSLTPTPAPTAPLPQLPAQAQRPSTRGSDARRSPRPPAEEPVPAFSGFKSFDHSRLASYMTNENTVIFRRFDDVHVRLLLCLQDEISQLESELLDLESATALGSASEKLLQRSKVLRELRKVVAEYGKLTAG